MRYARDTTTQPAEPGSLDTSEPILIVLWLLVLIVDARFHRSVHEQYDFDPHVVEFDEETKTATDAAVAIGCKVSRIANSIVVVLGGDVAVVGGTPK